MPRVSLIGQLRRRLTSDGRERLNQSCMPLGMLDVERITRVSAPVSTIVTRPVTSTLFNAHGVAPSRR